jgi:hypothetical protein
MLTRNGFRVVVLAALTAAIVAVALNIWTGMAAPPEQRALWSGTEGGSPLDAGDFVVIAVAGLGVLLALAATAGFCAFWRPARMLAVTATVLLLAGEVFVHPLVHTTLAHAFGDAAALFWGMAIAFSYSPPIGESFDRKRDHA